MSARSSQAWKLARRLSERAGREVELRYHGPRRDCYGGWHVEWCDGPTRESMRALVAELAASFPAVAVARLYYDRHYSDASQAAALLGYLPAHLDELRRVDSSTARTAHDATEHPGRLDDLTKRRAWALCHADPTTSNFVTLATYDRLRTHGQQGWERVLAWLDGIVAATGDPEVVQLADARRRRTSR